MIDLRKNKKKRIFELNLLNQLMKNSIIEIRNKKTLYALIVKKKRKFVKKGVDFITDDKNLLKLGFLNHQKNHIIKSNIHLKKKELLTIVLKFF